MHDTRAPYTSVTSGSRNDCVRVQAGTEEIYSALRGHLPTKLVALTKIRDYTCQNTVRLVKAVRMLIAVNSDCPQRYIDLLQCR